MKISKKLNIKKDDLVLEIGSGHSPHYRSDVLCDKYLVNDERGGGLVKDRLAILGDGINLAFKDKSFDYVIASHVLEHATDPDKFLKEIMRVGKRGYIETPSMIWEILHPSRKYHRWMVLQIDGVLCLSIKDQFYYDFIFGTLFESGLIADNYLEYQLFEKALHKLFIVEYEWDGEFDYLINPTDEYFKSFFKNPWNEENFLKFCDKRTSGEQILNLTINLLDAFKIKFLNKPEKMWFSLLKDIRIRRKNIDLNSILACPKCKGDVEILQNEVKCSTCKLTFKRNNGIFDMVLK